MFVHSYAARRRRNILVRDVGLICNLIGLQEFLQSATTPGFLTLHFCNSCYIKIDIVQVRLVKMIGLEGSFGTVYRAVWRGSIVAAKVIQLGKDVDHVIGDVESVGTLNLFREC